MRSVQFLGQFPFSSSPFGFQFNSFLRSFGLVRVSGSKLRAISAQARIGLSSVGSKIQVISARVKIGSIYVWFRPFGSGSSLCLGCQIQVDIARA